MSATKEKALSLVGQGYIYGAQGQICSLAFRQQQARQYPDQEKNIMGTGAKWDGTPVWDCAQFTQEVAEVGGVKLVSGSTSQWKKTDWEQKGTIDTIPADELVFVFRQSKTNASVMQHVGVALGDGTCVHARGTAYGVVQQSMSQYAWTHWARPKWGEQTAKRPTLRNGSRGDAVRELQEKLLSFGFSLPKYGADGKFGDETDSAVRLFQSLHGLYVDGVVGEKTWAALDGEKAEEPTYTLTITGLDKAKAEAIKNQFGGTISEGGAANAVR